MLHLRPQFAVVREDPRLESRLVEDAKADAVLVVASGGCSALSLAHAHPGLRVTAFDANPLQLEHVRRKNEALAGADRAVFNVLHDDPEGLNQRGAFEGLFRTLRHFVEEFVASPATLHHFFHTADALERASLVDGWRASRFWSAAFATAFNDPFLHALFGPAATQHAAPGSYPAYFERAFTVGLLRADAPQNYFLHHVFLGHYLPGSLPGYLDASAPLPLELVQGGLDAVDDLAAYRVVSLSNIFDWSDDALVSSWLTLLAERGHPSVTVLVRQLNNQRPFAHLLPAGFVLDEAEGTSLLGDDRSLFYERIVVLRRR